MALSRPFAETAGTAHDHGFHTLRIARVIPETGDASSYVLDVPEELRQAFGYEAGQFCTFRVRVNGHSLLRSYSMSSSPAVDGVLKVTVKRTEGGVVSNWMLDQLSEGDVVELTRPAGVFCLTPGDGDVVAFCAGSGITPVHSILKTALATTRRWVRLLYANRDSEAVIFGSEIEALCVQYPDRLWVTHHLDVEHGFVQPDDVRAFLSPDRDADYYVCGPTPFMDVVESELLARGVAAEHIHMERFTPAGQPAEPTEPDLPGEGTQVTVELSGRTASTEHRHGTTILQTARQMGMSPPFSCEAGNCATCMAKLVTGTASMHVNNALTDDEVADGWVLTCQAVPTSPTVHVVYSYEEQ